MSSAGTPSTDPITVRASAPCRTSALDQLVWSLRPIKVKNPPNPNYISNSLWGVIAGAMLDGLLGAALLREKATPS
jgi:hypothetical protein